MLNGPKGEGSPIALALRPVRDQHRLHDLFGNVAHRVGECDRNSVLVLSISPIDLIVSKYWVIMTSCMTSAVDAPATVF
jgi:hypothetical protein